MPKEINSVNSKYNLSNIIKLIFFIGTFILSFLTILIIIVASMHADGLKTSFIFSHPTITNILIIIVFFVNIAKYTNNKIYYWLALTTLISATITLIFSSNEMAQNVELLLNRHDIFNFFFRLHKIILPSLYLIFYIFLDRNTLSKKRSLLVIFVYPLIYVFTIQILGSLSFINAKGSDTLKNFFSIKGFIFNTLKIMFLFLPLTPSVLGIIFLKEEFANKHQLKKIFLVVGIFLISISLSGFWYPSPFSKPTLNTFNSKNFANYLMKSYDNIVDLEKFSQDDEIQPLTTITDNRHPQTISRQNSSTNEIIIGCPNEIYKDQYFENTVSQEELIYVQKNWETIKNNQYKYTFNNNQRKIFWKNSNNNLIFHRQTKGFFGNWHWS